MSLRAGSHLRMTMVAAPAMGVGTAEAGMGAGQRVVFLGQDGQLYCIDRGGVATLVNQQGIDTTADDAAAMFWMGV